MEMRSERPASSAARRARVFLYTLYSASAARREARRSASSLTLRPRYSVSTAARDASSFSLISSTVAAFSGRAMALLVDVGLGAPRERAGARLPGRSPHSAGSFAHYRPLRADRG